MNKQIRKMALVGLACVALCGTTFAAPAREPNRRQPQQQRPPNNNRPATNRPQEAAKPQQPNRPQQAQRPPQAKLQQQPRPKKNPPPRPHRAERHHGGTLQGEDWLMLGAGVLGGIVGSLLGA